MQVIQAPNQALRVTTKPVKKITPALSQTFKEMIKLTKTYQDPEGVGLASTQIGQKEKFFIAKIGEEFICVINPEITFRSKTTKKYLEGCLSIPNHYGTVTRHLSIRVKYQNETGKVITKSLREVPAWIFQHEVDHLNGVLFVDHVLEQKGKFYKVVGKDKTGTDIFELLELFPQSRRPEERSKRRRI